MNKKEVAKWESNEMKMLSTIRAENAQLRQALQDVAFSVGGMRKTAIENEILDSIAPHPLYAAAPEMLIALEKCQPYMNDLEGENFDDASAGIFQDKELSLAVETLRFAIKKAKGESYL